MMPPLQTCIKGGRWPRLHAYAEQLSSGRGALLTSIGCLHHLCTGCALDRRPAERSGDAAGGGRSCRARQRGAAGSGSTGPMHQPAPVAALLAAAMMCTALACAPTTNCSPHLGSQVIRSVFLAVAAGSATMAYSVAGIGDARNGALGSAQGGFAKRVREIQPHAGDVLNLNCVAIAGSVAVGQSIKHTSEASGAQMQKQFFSADLAHLEVIITSGRGH